MTRDLYELVSRVSCNTIIAQGKLSKKQYKERYKKIFIQMVLGSPSKLQEEEPLITELDIISFYEQNSSILEIISISNNFSIIILQEDVSGKMYIDIFYYDDYLRINKLDDSTIDDSTIDDSTIDDSDAVKYALYLYCYHIIKQSYNLFPI